MRSDEALRAEGHQLAANWAAMWAAEAKLTDEMRAAGWSWNRISRCIDVSVSTLIRRYGGG